MHYYCYLFDVFYLSKLLFSGDFFHLKVQITQNTVVKLALLLPIFVLASAQWTRGAKMSFKFPLLMMLLLCLNVVDAQIENAICGRNGAAPCWKREQPEQGAVIQDTPKKFIQPLAKLSNKRSWKVARKKKLRNIKRHVMSKLPLAMKWLNLDQSTDVKLYDVNKLGNKT